MLQFLSHRLTILIAFISINVFGLLEFVFFKELAHDTPLPYEQYLLIKIASLTVYSIFAYFTYKDIKLIRWLMALIILLTGLIGVLMGVFKIDWHQYFLKPYFIIFGIYFIYGGMILFRSSNSLVRDSQ